MHGIQRRQVEMLKRVRDFGNIYGEVLSSSPVTQELLATVDTAIAEVAAADVKKLEASRAAGARRKAAARRALLDVLRKGGQLTRALQAEGHTVPLCDPPASQSDESLLTAGRQLAAQAARFATAFDGHGMPSADIARATTALEQAAAARGSGLSDRTAAIARIRGVLRGAQRQVRRLDLIVANLLAHDESALAVWQQARRIPYPRRGRGSAILTGLEDEPSASDATPVQTHDPVSGVVPLESNGNHSTIA